MKKYYVHYEGTCEVLSDSEDECEIMDEVYDLIFGNPRTRLDAHASIEEMKIIDEEDVEE